MKMMRAEECLVVFDAVEDAYLRFDSEFRLTFANLAAERFLGGSRTESLGKTLDDLFPGISCTPLGDAYRRAMSARDAVTVENYSEPERKWYSVSASPDAAGGIVVRFSDVTDSKQEHRESEELYRQLFELESDAIVLVDRESGQLLAANKAATTLYGYSREELLCMNRTDLSAEAEKTIEATMNRRTFIPLRWHRKKDGTVFPVEISGSYFEFKGRSVFVSAIRDITNRKLIKEALEKSEEKFSKAFHSNPAAIVITDLTDQCYVEVNHTFEHLVGYRRDEIVGHTWAELPLWTDPNLRDDAVAQLMRKGSIRNWECRFRRKNGDEGTGLLSAELIEVDGKQCAITSTVDITQRIQLESQLGQAQKLESVGRLAGGVAHDFNNLLTIINGYGDLILKALPADHPLHSYAQEICKAGAHAVGLTGQLLAFSRKQVIQPSALDVNTIVNDTVVMLRRLIGEDISLTTSLDPLAGQVMADGHQLHQIIMNLAVNARDAMPDGGRLKIATEQCRCRRERSCRASRRTRGKIRGDERDGQRRWHGPGDAATRLRTVLHHEGARQGNRARIVHRLRHRPAERRMD